MDTLTGGFPASMAEFKLNPKSISSCSTQSHAVNGFKLEDYHILDPEIEQFRSEETSSDLTANLEGEIQEESAFLKYISEMLMEEDLQKQNCMFQNCMALQAAEKSFYDVLTGKSHSEENLDFQGSDFNQKLNWDDDFSDFPYSDEQIPQVGNKFKSSLSFSDMVDELVDSPVSTLLIPTNPPWKFKVAEHKTEDFLNSNWSLNIPDSINGRKNNRLESNDFEEYQRINKHFAIFSDEPEELDIFDKVLLCNGQCKKEEDNDASKLQQNGKSKLPNTKKITKKIPNKTEMVDLRTILTQCAQAVASNDQRTAMELLTKIRENSSIFGDGSQRLAHYFAEGLHARLLGSRAQLQTVLTMRTPASEILKAYQVYVKACPFKQMSNIYANKTIMKHTQNSTRIHIIDFGILYGFQWPCLIQALSNRPGGGPPRLRITGIELPQPGFRPAERAEDTGRRLEKYCKKFNVPFEYNAIAQKWETIKLEDLKLDGDETVIVNCLYRFKNLPDDTTVTYSPRDAVLNLIKRINPEMFIHGVVNGTYNAPFFLTRFRETLFHYSALFDMFESTVPHEDPDRLMLEKEIFGRDAINVIACEGLERVDRPETYKQWRARNLRAGFQQILVDEDIFKQVRKKVKSYYHKEFVVDENGGWLLQGWKGRIIYALSCWKPAY